MDMNIGQNLRKIREDLDLDILDVSIDTGYSESHLAQIERDKRKPSMDCLIDLIKYYKCEPNKVFGYHKPLETDVKNSFDERLNNLDSKDKSKVSMIMETTLQVFEEVE